METIYPRTLFGKITYLIKLLIINAILAVIIFAATSSYVAKDPNVEASLSKYKTVEEFFQNITNIPIDILLTIFLWPSIIPLAFILYFFADFCHRKLIVNDQGVYQKGGFMPWNNGFYGIDYEYIESAYFYQGLFPWLLQDYTIEIKRNKTEQAFKIYHISKAINAVKQINNNLRNMHNPDRIQIDADTYIEQG